MNDDNSTSSLVDSYDDSAVEGNSGATVYGVFLIVLAAVNTPLCVAGVVGNLVSLYVLIKRSLARSCMFFFLKALNVCDVIVLISSAAFIVSICKLQNQFVAVEADTEPEPGQDGSAYGYVTWMNVYVLASLLYYVSTSTSTMLVMLISLERWIAVCKSMVVHNICTPTRVRTAVAAAVLLSVALVAPRTLEVRYESRWTNGSDEVGGAGGGGGGGMGALMFAYDGFSLAYLVGYRIVLYTLVSFVAPLVLIIVCNAHLVSVIREAYRQSLTLTLTLGGRVSSKGASARGRARTLAPVRVWGCCVGGQDETEASCLGVGGEKEKGRVHIYEVAEHKVAVVGVCIVIVFCLSAVPSLVIELYESYELLMNVSFQLQASAFRHYLPMLSKLLMTVNCSVNVVIYCLCTEQFRSLLRRKQHSHSHSHSQCHSHSRGHCKISWRFAQHHNQHHNCHVLNNASVTEPDAPLRLTVIRTDTTRTVTELLA